MTRQRAREILTKKVDTFLDVFLGTEASDEERIVRKFMDYMCDEEPESQELTMQVNYD